MANLSQRLREPLVLFLLVAAAFGWVAFFAMWINASTQGGTQQQTIAQLTAERDAATSQLSERAATGGSLQEVQRQLAAGQQELESVTASLDTARADLAAVSEELATNQAALETTRAETNAVNEQAAAAAQQVGELDAHRQALQAQIDEANSQLADIGTRLEEARALEATTTANVAQFTQEAASATATLSETQTQLQEARNQLSAAQTQMAELATQIETAGADLATLQQQVAELTGQRDTLAAELQSYQSQRDELQPQVEQLTATLASRSQELADVEAGLAGAMTTSDAANGLGRFTVSGEGSAQGLGLTLAQDGSFILESRNGRAVTGRYTLDDTQLRLTDATGDLGNATFPMVCPVTRTDAGFTIEPADTCALSDLTFERNR